MSNNTLKPYPKKIYLQWHGDEPDSDPEGPEPAEVTWSKEPVFDYDIEYALATPMEDGI